MVTGMISKNPNPTGSSVGKVNNRLKIIKMNLPEIIANIMDNKEDGINTCRVNIVEGKLSVTSIISIQPSLADIIRKNSGKILSNIQNNLSKCTNFSILPSKTGQMHATCSTLTLTVDASHNDIKQVNTLAEFATVAHQTVLDALQKDIILSNINKDMKTYD